MIEILQIVATSWPIALMVICISIAVVVSRRWKQAMDNQLEVQNIRSSQAVVVRSRED